MRRPLTVTVVAALLALGVSACGSEEDDANTATAASAAAATTPPATSTPSTAAAPATQAAPSATAASAGCEKVPGGAKDVPCPKKTTGAGTNTVTMRTSQGTFTITLDVKRAPKTANSFAYLAKRGFFDGTVFHRVVPDFVIQGGDPYATGRGEDGGAGGPGYRITEAPPADLQYTRGVVAMAKTQAEAPGASGSQFYVVTGKDVGLPAEYALVGKVTKGMGAVDKISALGQGDGPPSKAVTIKKATFAKG